MHTITSADVPDSYFTGRALVSSWRPAAIGDFGNSLNYFIREQLATSASGEVASQGVTRYEAEPCIDFLAGGSITNVAISAIGPAVAEFNSKSAAFGISHRRQSYRGAGTMVDR
jgi:hypothetical protein